MQSFLNLSGRSGLEKQFQCLFQIGSRLGHRFTLAGNIQLRAEGERKPLWDGVSHSQIIRFSAYTL